MMPSKDQAKFTKPSDREVVMTKVFDAPRELVWKAYTDPRLIPRWWGPRYLTTTIDKMDVKPGGAWRFVSRGPDGSESAFHGVYREVVKPDRLSWLSNSKACPATCRSTRRRSKTTTVGQG
jgi:uncharacterized protein YndB with AHSA1/START domain